MTQEEEVKTRVQQKLRSTLTDAGTCMKKAAKTIEQSTLRLTTLLDARRNGGAAKAARG